MNKNRTIRLLTDLGQFYKKIINIIDVVILICLYIFVGVQIWSGFKISNFIGELESVILDIRYLLQIYRIFVLYKQTK